MLHQDSLVNQNRRGVSGGLRRTGELDSELFALQEQLHRRIASELHDSTCQHLVAASLGLMQIRNALSDPPTIERHCQQLDVSINCALKELRSVAYLLLPQDLCEEDSKLPSSSMRQDFPPERRWLSTFPSRLRSIRCPMSSSGR